MLYAVGDIHGRFDLLKILHQKITKRAATQPGPHTIVFLGDYIDRGPDSKGVVDFLATEPFEDFKHIFLKGNHEDMAIGSFYYDPDGVMNNPSGAWMINGGKETLNSYGSSDDEYWINPGAAREKVKSLILFIYKTVLTYREGNYFFVHAGINPLVEIDSVLQDESYFLWVRDKFLNYRSPFDDKAGNTIIVVHGHTPNEKYESLPNRINLDSGAKWTNILSAVELNPEDMKHRFFITT